MAGSQFVASLSEGKSTCLFLCVPCREQKKRATEAEVDMPDILSLFNFINKPYS